MLCFNKRLFDITCDKDEVILINCYIYKIILFLYIAIIIAIVIIVIYIPVCVTVYITAIVF